MAANYSVHSPPGVIVTVSGTQITYLPCAKAYEWTGQFSKPSSKKKNSNVIYLLKTNQHNATRQLRDRPFNLKGGGGLCFFVSFKKNVSDNTRVRIFYFFLSRKVRIFFPEYHIRLYDKNSESDYFFSSTKIRIFFSATLGIRIFF
jgi:hypothetical protein